MAMTAVTIVTKVTAVTRSCSYKECNIYLKSSQVVTAPEKNLSCRRCCWGSLMTYVYTTSVAALQRSVSYSCYNSKSWLLDIAVTIQLLLIISCYRARIAIHVLGVVRQSIKVLAPTRQPLGLTLKQMCLFYKICFPFFVSKFLVRIIPLVK